MKATGTLITLVAIVTTLVYGAPAGAQDKAAQADAAKPAARTQTQASQDMLPAVNQAISINEAVDLALKNNPRPLGQTAEARAAQARIGMATAMTRPQVSTTTFATTGSMPAIIPGSPNAMPQAAIIAPDDAQLDQNFMAMYPLYTGGRLKGQVRSAQAQFSAVTQGVRTSQLDVALETKNAYRRVQLAQKVVEANQRRVDEATERLRIAEVSFAEGKIARYDLLRNQTELAEAQQELNNSQRDVETALVDLKSVMGVSLDSNITLTESLTSVPLTQTQEAVRSQALSQRPELAAVRARIQAAEASLGVAKSAYKPQVYAVAMSDIAAMSGEGFDTGFTVGLTASIPILDGGQRRSAVSESQAMLDRMRAEEREMILMINRDVGTAWAEQSAAARNVELAGTAITQAEEDYRIIRLRYEAGRATNVEVLDALASLIRAQTNLAEAQFEYNTAQDRLNRAIGNT